MDVPTHLCAHTPCTCGNAMHTGTLTPHTCAQGCTEPWKPLAGDASLRLLCGAGRTGGALLREEPRAAHRTRSPSPQPSVLAPRPRPRSEAGQGHLTPASLPSHRPALLPARNRESHPAPNHSWGHHVSLLCRPRVLEAPSPPRAACTGQGAGPSPRGGCRSMRRSRPLHAEPPVMPLRSL